VLTGVAADEWYRVAAGLHALGLLTEVDVMPLAAYCQAYKRWRTAEEELAKIADDETSGLLIKTQHGAQANPLVRISAKAAQDMVRYASEFGFTPAARARVAIGVRETGPSKWDGLIA